MSSRRMWTQQRESIDESKGNNNDNPSTGGSSLRRCISWPWRKACLVLSWSENMNKTSTTKDTRRKEIKWLVREKK